MKKYDDDFFYSVKFDDKSYNFNRFFDTLDFIHKNKLDNEELEIKFNKYNLEKDRYDTFLINKNGDIIDKMFEK